MAAPKTGRRSAGRAGLTMSARDRRGLAGARSRRSTPPRSTTPRSGSRRPGELAAFPNLRVIFNLGAGVDALMADSSLPERAAGSRRGRRSHRPDDRICRAACADAPSAGTLSAGQPARKTLGAEIAMAGQRDFGRHHGARHAGRGRRPGAGAARLSRRGLEPKPEAASTASTAFTARRNSMRFCGAPISWSACCR